MNSSGSSSSVLPSISCSAPQIKVASALQRHLQGGGSPRLVDVQKSYRSDYKSPTSLSPFKNSQQEYEQCLKYGLLNVKGGNSLNQLPKKPYSLEFYTQNGSPRLAPISASSFDTPSHMYMVKSKKQHFVSESIRRTTQGSPTGSLSNSSLEIRTQVRQKNFSPQPIQVPQSQLLQPLQQTPTPEETIKPIPISSAPSESGSPTRVIPDQVKVPLPNKQLLQIVKPPSPKIVQPPQQQVESTMPVVASMNHIEEPPAQETGKQNEQQNEEQQTSNKYTKFKSYKEINEAHARHIEQRDALIEKWRNAHAQAHQEMRKNSEQVVVYEKLAKKNEHLVHSLREELKESHLYSDSLEKKLTALKEEMIAIRVDAAQMHNLENENAILRQQYSQTIKKSKKLEESVAEQQNQYKLIRNWNIILNIPSPSLLPDCMVMKVADYQTVLSDMDTLKKSTAILQGKIRKLEEEAMTAAKEKNGLIEEIATRNTRIELLLEPEGFSKVFKRFSEKGLDEIEREIMKMVKIVQVKGPTAEAGMEFQAIEHIRTQLWSLKNNQTQILSSMSAVQLKFVQMNEILLKYPFLEEFNAIQKEAVQIFKCSICEKSLTTTAITHVPCGHNVCTECHTQREAKIAAQKKATTDLLSTEINTCTKCGKHPQGNWTFPNKPLGQTFSFYNHLAEHIDNIKILILKP